MGFDTQAQAFLQRLQPLALRLRGPVLLALTYYLGARLAFYVGTLSDQMFALLWFPNVILFCALLIVPYRSWGLYIACAFVAHVVAELGVGMGYFQLVVAFVTNCLVAVLNAFLVRRIPGAPPWFDSFRKALFYVAITAGVAPALSALGGAFVPIIGSGPLNEYWVFWAYWYVANALPSLTLGPVFLTWAAENHQWRGLASLRPKVEATVLVVALVAVCVVAFQVSPLVVTEGFLPALLYSPLPLILWATARYGAKGASGAILIVTIVSMWLTFKGNKTVFADANPERAVLALQLFLTGLSVPVLLLGATVEGLRHARRRTRELAGALLRAQDEERRRIARELHDSTGQNLIAASLVADRLQSALPKVHEPALMQLDNMLQQSIRELRTVSYLLHPPLLDESGLQTALHHYIAGYTERSGIIVDLYVSPSMERLPANVELVLFRVVQEALVNVSRHSGSGTARIELARRAVRDGQEVVLTVEDFGKGMPGMEETPLGGSKVTIAAVSGVGLAGMQERLRQIGGRLAVESSVGRTVVRASIPIEEDLPAGGF